MPRKRTKPLELTSEQVEQIKYLQFFSDVIESAERSIETGDGYFFDILPDFIETSEKQVFIHNLEKLIQTAKRKGRQDSKREFANKLGLLITE
jgi:hypothetical protein